MDCCPPGPSVHGIFQARILEWVAISFSRRSSRPRDQTCVSCLAGRFFTYRTHVSCLVGGFFTSEPPFVNLKLHYSKWKNPVPSTRNVVNNIAVSFVSCIIYKDFKLLCCIPETKKSTILQFKNKNISEVFVLYDSICMKFWKRQKYIERK